MRWGRYVVGGSGVALLGRKHWRQVTGFDVFAEVWQQIVGHCGVAGQYDVGEELFFQRGDAGFGGFQFGFDH